MAAGQGYIEFATGDVLTAASANGYLASQVVMVFADAAARTSAIVSPQEGMISYLKDTNSTEYYSGSAWVALGGSSGALTLITSQDFSSSSSVSVNNVFSSTYLNYKVIVTTTAVSGNFDLDMRLRVSGADNSTSNYNFWGMFSDGTSNFFGSSSTDLWRLGNAIGGTFAVEANIFQPFASQVSQFTSLNSTYNRYRTSGGVFNATTSFTGFTLLPSSNNMTGTVKVYGIGN